MPTHKDLHLTQTQVNALLEAWLGQGVTCRDAGRCEGGISSMVLHLQFDRAPYSAIVKLQDNPEDDPLPREQARLDYLRQHTNVPCPKVYLQDDSRSIIPYSFLLLERLSGVNLKSAQLKPEQRTSIERELAEVLLELHSHTRSKFGSFGEEPGMCKWADVFMPRLEGIRRDMNKFLSASILKEVDRAIPLAEDALRPQGRATLVHNDVSAGNIMVQQRHDVWHLSGLLDPVGLQYADVELELAYLQAFDTVGQTFFDVYASRQPLRPGYEFRRLFYWLHTYMVHVWLGFGADFHDRIGATTGQIISLAARSRRTED
jgi:fructosamine-3-kinase